MDSGIHMHLALAKLQDSLRDAETARSARAVPRLPHPRPETRLATAWQRRDPDRSAREPATGTNLPTA